MCYSKTAKTGERESWVDNVKLAACILVVLGHFFQSMVKAEILLENDLYLWFEQTIYLFHVPLFFICSGYLYQKRSKVESLETWKRHVLRKALILGVPYFTFSAITWILKAMFSNSVNDQVDGFFQALILRPLSPYWYLYALFFLFMITPTFAERKEGRFGILFALILKAFSILAVDEQIPYAALKIVEYEIWFVFGMYFCLGNFQKKIDKKAGVIGVVTGGVCFLLSILLYKIEVSIKSINFLLGCGICLSIIIVIIFLSKSRKSRINKLGAKYTMPIYLMHTIFAAAFRSVLSKFGIKNAVVHMVLGIAISFIGPIVVTTIMEKFVWLDFLLNPGKYVYKKLE